MKMKVLVLGSTGLLGNTLTKVLSLYNHKVVRHGTKTEFEANFTDQIAIRRMLDQIQPDAIINLIGLTDVELCERCPNEAYLVNVKTVENIVAWLRSQATSVRLVHISTDQVYDGLGPHKESEVSLKNYYGFSKFTAEMVALQIPSIVLRTNFFGFGGHARRKSLTDWLYQNLSDRKSIKVFNDVTFNPLSMNTLSEIVQRLIKVDSSGIFNLGSHEGVSKAEFAYLFADKVGLPKECMESVSVEEVDFLKTYRPKDMRMDCEKFEKQFKIRLPSLSHEIKQTAQEYKSRGSGNE